MVRRLCGGESSTSNTAQQVQLRFIPKSWTIAYIDVTKKKSTTSNTTSKTRTYGGDKLSAT